MCGRFTNRFTWKELHERLDLVGTPLNLRPRYNVAPSQDVAVARATEGGRILSMLRWGMIPSWARDPAIGHKLVNARSETVAEKPSFRSAFRHRRCLIPADGFYEWQRRGGTRQPWLFGLRDGAPLVFAGLWERWTVPEGAALAGSLAERSPGDAVETCTILDRRRQRDGGARPWPHAGHPAAGLLGCLALGRRRVPLAPYPAGDMTAHGRFRRTSTGPPTTTRAASSRSP